MRKALEHHKHEIQRDKTCRGCVAWVKGVVMRGHCVILTDCVVGAMNVRMAWTSTEALSIDS